MILVVGGTGDLGGRVVLLLRQEDVEVRCLVRPGRDDTRLRQLGAQVVRGDLTDPGSLAPACEGVDTVVATATVIARRLEHSDSASIRAVDEDGMADLVAAAESSGVERFVYLSFPGVENAVGTPLEQAKLAIEQRLARSSVRAVVIRADGFQEIHLAPTARFDTAAGKVAIIGKGDTRRRWISTADVAALVAAVALEPDPPGVITVGGPEALSKNEAVAFAEELTGRPMKVQHMPRPVARLAVRLLARRRDALASAFGAGLLQDLQPATWDDAPLRERGIDPTAPRDFLRQQVRRS